MFWFERQPHIPTINYLWAWEDSLTHAECTGAFQLPSQDVESQAPCPDPWKQSFESGGERRKPSNSTIRTAHVVSGTPNSGAVICCRVWCQSKGTSPSTDASPELTALSKFTLWYIPGNSPQSPGAASVQRGRQIPGALSKCTPWVISAPAGWGHPFHGMYLTPFALVFFLLCCFSLLCFWGFISYAQRKEKEKTLKIIKTSSQEI